MLESERNSVMTKIEKSICDVVNYNIDRIKGGKNKKGFIQDIYCGKTKTTYSLCMIRGFVYYVFHDLYGYSYRTIGKRCSRSIDGIIKHVRHIREWIEIDDTYKKMLVS